MSTIAERIDYRLSQLPPQRAERLELLLMGLLEFVEPESALTVPESDEENRQALGMAALSRIATRGGIAGIADPVAWQQEQRAERPLPGRDS
jgi:hypothetical protein